MRKDRSNRPPLTPRQLSPPRSRIEMLENNLIHPLVDGITLHQHPAKISASPSL
jgi:hypothetical protein